MIMAHIESFDLSMEWVLSSSCSAYMHSKHAAESYQVSNQA